MGTSKPQVRRLDPIITSDKSRVLIRPFVPGSAARMKSVLGRVLGLDENEAARVLSKVFEEFGSRHRHLEETFRKRFLDLKPYVSSRSGLSATVQTLIGAYFTSEYALEAAALFNPSIVPHPNQDGLPGGSLRFVLSLRATGEGHISSIEFRTGVIAGDGTVKLDAKSRYTATPDVLPDPVYDKAKLLRSIGDDGYLDPGTKQIVSPLKDSFSRSALSAAVKRFRAKHKKLSGDRESAISYLETFASLNYDIRFASDVDLSERVIFPVSARESNGIEDARFVRFTDSGSSVYYATYTAYDGKQIMPLLLETKDFLDVRVRSLSGKAARNKGMALFPRKIQGRFVMISRQDGENLYCVTSDSVLSWQKPGALLKPTFPWEFTQIGNCGSPIETKEGWLLLTHGVGPVRKYCIGAVLLDLENPSKVVKRLKEPLIEPNESEREGYVPNVVYTCGALEHNGNLIIPYAMSDQSSRFATIRVTELLNAMQ